MPKREMKLLLNVIHNELPYNYQMLKAIKL